MDPDENLNRNGEINQVSEETDQDQGVENYEVAEESVKLKRSSPGLKRAMFRTSSKGIAGSLKRRIDG